MLLCIWAYGYNRIILFPDYFLAAPISTTWRCSSQFRCCQLTKLWVRIAFYYVTVIFSGCVEKKKSLPPQIENENDTYLVYEVKFPFPLGATQYHREIWNTTSVTACSDNTALLRGWERSELQNLHLKDWAVTFLLQADNKKCPWKPFLCLSNNPWAKKALEDVNYKGQANMAGVVIILFTLFYWFPTLVASTPKIFLS